MLTKKQLRKINRLRKRQKVLENKIQRIQSAINKITNKLFHLIVRKK